MITHTVRKVTRIAVAAWAALLLPFVLNAWQLHAQTQSTSCTTFTTYYRQIIRTVDGAIVELNDENVDLILAALADCSSSRLSEVQQALAAQRRDIFDRSTPTRQSQVELKLLDLLIDYSVADFGTMADISSMASVIEQRKLNESLDLVRVRRARSNPQGTISLPPRQSRNENLKATQAYIVQCRGQGIAVPDEFTKPLLTVGKTKGWTEEIKIKSDKNVPYTSLFLSPETESSFWIYKELDSKDKLTGFCVAMQRKFPKSGSGTFHEAFVGTICTDAAQSKACFFDNLTYDANGATVEMDFDTTVSTPYAGLIQPKHIENYCTSCHIGENPFLVKPASTIGAKFVSELGYSPVPGDAKDLYEVWEKGFLSEKQYQWRNGDDFVPAIETGGACETCHSLSKPLKIKGKSPLSTYCTNILEVSALHTMPPGDPTTTKRAGWEQKDFDLFDQKYAQSIFELRNFCLQTE